jgi:putative endopeptidase
MLLVVKKMTMKNLLTIAAALTISSSNAQQNPGIRLSYIDSSSKPCNDFYGYCNGKWQKSFKLSPSDSRYGSFNEINDNNLKNIFTIYAEVSKDKAAKPGSNMQKLRDFYNTAMDSAKADQLGLKPIQPLLAQIDKVKTVEEIITLKNKLDLIGIRLFYVAGVDPDIKNSKRHLFYFGQGGYALGDKDFYYNPKMDVIAQKYKEHIAKMLVLGGEDKTKATEKANQIFELEKKILEKGKTTPEMRDQEKLYNPISKAEFNKLAPHLKLDSYFYSMGIPFPDTVVIHSPDYFAALNAIVSTTDVNILKAYTKWLVLHEAAPYLSSDIAGENFDFYGKTLSGAQVQKVRWQRVHNVVNTQLGDIVSEAYVKKYFPQSSKDKLLVLIDNLIAAYRERIDSRTWMDAATKKQAHRKLDLLIKKIGFPDKWKDYTPLQITTNSYWENICKATNYAIKENLAELKKPVDRYKWLMTPVMVNAYYNPSTNEITFPAAILQPPFYDPNAEDAANYGTMGAIIGHELTHGFDDQGAQYDADGNLKNWWSETDLKNFKEKQAAIVAQFDGYVAIDDVHVNGSQTQGENIADLGGLTMAYYAYKKSLKGQKSSAIGGYTGEQRLFIAWCQGWKSFCRDAELKRLITVDFHSPGYFRAWAPLTNMNEFYQAFDLKPGDKLYVAPEKRIEIW